MQRVISFLKKLTHKDEPLIIFHNDTDGICSCVLMNKFLQKRIRKKADIISQPMPPQKNLMSKIKMCLPTKIMFLDLAIDQKRRFVKRLENFCDILIIDHHPVTNDMNSERTVHFNPRLKNKDIYQSASYLVYKICSRFPEFEKKKLLWVAAVGAIGDYDLSGSSDLIKEAKKEYPEIIKKTDDKSLRESLFGQIAEIITAAKACNIPPEEIAKIIYESKSCEEVLNNQTLINAYKQVQAEIEKLIIDAKSKFDPNKKIFFYEIKSKFSLRAVVATRLSEMWPDKIVIVWQKVRNKIRVAGRNQSRKFDVGNLLKSALTPGMKASFGGHPAASGGIIDEKDWDEFRERLIRAVENKN